MYSILINLFLSDLTLLLSIMTNASLTNGTISWQGEKTSCECYWIAIEIHNKIQFSNRPHLWNNMHSKSFKVKKRTKYCSRAMFERWTRSGALRSDVDAVSSCMTVSFFSMCCSIWSTRTRSSTSRASMCQDLKDGKMLWLPRAWSIRARLKAVQHAVFALLTRITAT